MIEIYADRGSSHSLVWLVDLLASARLPEVRLVDAAEVTSLSERAPSCMMISGGDGYDIARALGRRGFSSLTDYIADGGLYLGTCAGAYLPLPSRLEPFSAFNLSTTRIRNVGAATEGDPRYSVPYGSCSILHPVRGMMSLGGPAGECEAPTYGGPIFEEPDEDEVLLRFLSFAEGTEFHVPVASAERMVIGSPAAISCAYGAGRLILLGPHLDFPGCSEGNRILLDLLPHADGARANRSACAEGRSDRELDLAISDLRVAILGLENRSFVSSSKVWDGGRLMELVDAIDRAKWAVDADRSRRVAELLARVRSRLMAATDPAESGLAETPYDLVEGFRICANERLAAIHR